MTKWPADKIEMRKIGELEPYAKNSRMHSDKQIDQLANSIQEFGWTNPCIIDRDGALIAGHARIIAATRLGIKDVPCVVIDGWSPEKKRAYVIADNRLAENSEWDIPILFDEIISLADFGADIDKIGFDSAELDDLLGETPKCRQVTKNINPITWTHILLSVPVDTKIPPELDVAIEKIVKSGGRADYGGN